MERLIEAIQEIPEVAELLRSAESGGCPAAMTGLGPVHRAHMGAALLRGGASALLALCADEGEARRMAADLQAFTGEEAVVLPGREFRSTLRQSPPGAGRNSAWRRSTASPPAKRGSSRLRLTPWPSAPCPKSSCCRPSAPCGRAMPPNRRSWRSICSAAATAAASRWRAQASLPCVAAFSTCSAPAWRRRARGVFRRRSGRHGCL